MSKPNLILIGAGGHASACIDIIEDADQYRIAGLVGLPEQMHTKHLGYSVIATDSDLPKLAQEYQYAFIALGQIKSPENRIRLFQQTIELGFKLPAIIASTAYVSRHASIGTGTIVMHGTMVNTGARVGVNCIINTHALLEHDSTVQDHCHISTGATINGHVNIGMGSFVGSGSIIKEAVSLGKDCMVGMGLSVRHNQPDHTRFVGNDKS